MRLALLVALLATASHAQTSTALYRVTLDATWSAQTHPDGFPPDPHFSPLVGAVHNEEAWLWEADGFASDGMEQMAESGRTSPLVAEAEVFVIQGSARAAVTGGAIPTSPGAVSMDIEVSTEHPLVTIVSMLAPSPDWFVGTESLDLREGAGWTPRVEVPMYVWDAGTDSGPTYTSPNDDTDPAERIARIEAAPFVVGGTLTPVGTMTFDLLSVTSNEEAPETGLRLEVSPNPVRGIARVSVSNARPGSRLLVLDTRGRAVREIETAGEIAEVDVSDLAAGVYVLRLISGSEAVTRRLVVVR